MYRRWAFVSAMALALVAGSVGVQSGVGGDKKVGKDAPRAKETDSQKALARLAVADELIELGLANKSPAALLAAAEIIHSVKVDDDPKLVAKETDVEKPKSDAASRSPAALVTKAKEFAKGSDWTAAIAATQRRIEEASQSPAYGTVNRHGHIHGGRRHSYTIHCHGHTHARVHPYNSNGPVDLDLYVYDAYGNQVAIDRGSSPSAHVHWDGDGDFRVEVHMFAGDHTDYHLTVR